MSDTSWQTFFLIKTRAKASPPLGLGAVPHHSFFFHSIDLTLNYIPLGVFSPHPPFSFPFFFLGLVRQYPLSNTCISSEITTQGIIFS